MAKSTVTTITDENALSPDAGQFFWQNSTVVAAFVISFSVLVGAILGLGRKKV